MKIVVAKPAVAGLQILAVLLSAFVFIGCQVDPDAAKKAGGKDDPNKNPKPPRVVVPVEVTKPHRGDIADFYETFSRIEAESSVDVASEGTGRCTRIYKEEGDSVKQGEILAQLDPKEAEANLRQSEVQVRQQKAEYERARAALQAGLIAPADYDAAKFAYEQGLSSVELQRVQLAKLTIKAPITGIVQSRMIQKGQLISSGSPVYRIVDPSTYKLVINPPERDLSKLREGQKALVTIDALEGKSFDAVVSRVNPMVDSMSGTIKVTLSFADETVGELLEAALARIRLVVETRENALLLPKDAVIEENTRHFVFVVGPKKEFELEEGEEAPPEPSMEPDGTATRVDVTLGLDNSQFVEITDGLDGSESVVTLGQYNLKDGTEIHITSAEAEVQANLDLSPEEAIAQAKAKRGNDGGADRRRMREKL